MCNCKAKCTTRVCSCRKAGNLCSERCHPVSKTCQNLGVSSSRSSVETLIQLIPVQSTTHISTSASEESEDEDIQHDTFITKLRTQFNDRIADAVEFAKQKGLPTIREIEKLSSEIEIEDRLT